MTAKPTRTAEKHRKTSETDIRLKWTADGQGESTINTGIPFFDHMLTLFARHGLFDLELTAQGDLDVDYHHTVEDTGLVLGEAVREALGEKRGIARYGFFILPMDETLARVVIDLSNRPAFVYQVNVPEPMVRDFNIGLVREFFQAFANAAACNLHITVEYGEEPHHVAESIFKCFARALDQATAIDRRQEDCVPSTKETLSR